MKIKVNFNVETYLLFFLCVSLYTFGQETDNGPKFYRFQEDYSYLKDRENKSFFESLKYIPLGDNAYLSIGGELKEYFLVDVNERWTTDIETNDYLRHRIMLHTDIHLGERFRFFGQLINANAFGRKPQPIGPDKNDLDVIQLFAEYKHTKGFLRIGRQEFDIGGHQLLKVREGLNQRLSFDAARLQWSFPKNTLNVFYARPVIPEAYVFDDNIVNDAIDFYGINNAFVPNANTRFDGFFFGYERKNARFSEAAGFEKRYTLGTRFTYNKKGWELDYELSYQFGTLAATDISAWGMATFTGYRFERIATQPKLELLFSYVSGDRESGDGKLNSFNPLFPRGNYFGETAVLTGINILNPGIALENNPFKNHRFRIDMDVLWRDQKADGLYLPPNILFQNSNPDVNENFIGTQITAAYHIDFNRFINGALVYAHLFTGAYIKQTITDVDVKLFSARLQFKF